MNDFLTCIPKHNILDIDNQKKVTQCYRMVCLSAEGFVQLQYIRFLDLSNNQIKAVDRSHCVHYDRPLLCVICYL